MRQGSLLSSFPKDKSADVNDVARKVASGAAETVPWVRVTNLARTIESLKQAGVWVIGTDGDAEESLYEQDLSGPCAMVLGSEGCGDASTDPKISVISRQTADGGIGFKPQCVGRRGCLPV